MSSLAKIQSSKRRGTLTTWFPIHATRAAAAYYLMTRRLCALYEVSHVGLLAQLKAQARRIEALSKAEHDMIKEVHPQVGEIMEGMQEVVDSVRENADATSPSKPQARQDKKK